MKDITIGILISDDTNLNQKSEFSFVVNNIDDNRKAFILFNPKEKNYNNDNYSNICWTFNGYGSFINKKSINHSISNSEYIVVALWPVTDESSNNFHSKTILNAELSVKNEKGCLSFGVFKSLKKESVFVLIEFFQTKTDFQEHLNTKHFLSFKKSVGDLYVGNKEQTIKGR